MHSIAGTIGYDLILDEQARQAAKQASRERAFDAAIRAAVLPANDPLLNRETPLTVTGGTSTPSTPASPKPYDAGAAREQERVKAAEYIRARQALTRSFKAIDLDLSATLRVERVKSVLEGLEHQARQYDAAVRPNPEDLSFTGGVAAGLALAVEQVRDALR